MYGVTIFSDATQIIGGIEVAGGVESTFNFATLSDAMAFSDAAQGAGFNYLYSTGNTIKWSNVIGGAGEYGMTAVGETGVVSGAGATEITVSGLEADAGLGLKAGGLTYGASALQLAGAVAVGAGIGLKSYHDYPEFWTDLSDSLFDGLGGSETMPVIMRAVEGGGIKSYVRERDVDTVLDNLYNLTKMHPEAQLEQYEDGSHKELSFDWDHAMVDTSLYNSYTMNNKYEVTPPASGAEVFNRAFDYFRQQYPGESPNYMDVTTGAYEYYGTPKTGYNLNMGYIPQPAYADVTTDHDSFGFAIPRTTSAVQGHFINIAGIWNRDGTFDRNLSASTTASHSLFGGLARTPSSQSQDPAARVGGLFTSIWANPAAIYDNQTKTSDDREHFWDVHSSWKDSGFSVPHFNPQTGEQEEERWLPLEIPFVLPDTILQPGVQPQTETQTGTQTDPDPVVEPVLKILSKYLPWFQVPSLPEGDTPDPTAPTPAFDTTSGSGLWAIYNPTKAEITALGQYLWSSNIVDIIEKFFKNSPLEAIISLHMIYCTPTTGAAQHIILGYLDSGVSADVVTNQYETIDCGSITVNEYFGDARDYVNTTVDIYLPFIGIRQLNTADIVGSKISLIYTCDVLTGVCLAQIFVEKSGVKQCLYQYEGNCSVQIPLTASDRSRLISGLTSSLASAVTGGAAGGAVGAVGGAVMGAIHGLANSATIQRTGGLSGNSGAMALKTPYIIITRKKANQLDNYYKEMGAAASYTARLGTLSGFTKVRSVQLDTLTCSSFEKDQIRDYLMNGVII